MHVEFLYSCSMYHRSYYMPYCCMHTHVFLLHDCFSLLLLILLLLIFPFLDICSVDMRCVASHIYCFLFPVIMLSIIVLLVTYTVLVLDMLCSSYLYSGTPVISTVTPASGGTCVELSATRSKVPHHTYPWWGPPLESVGATSRILTPSGVG